MKCSFIKTLEWLSFLSWLILLALAIHALQHVSALLMQADSHLPLTHILIVMVSSLTILVGSLLFILRVAFNKIRSRHHRH